MQTWGRKKRLIAVTAALVTVALPATAAGKPDQTDRKNAAQECRAERGNSAASREAFRMRYGTNKNKRNAFGKCVSRRANDEERERRNASKNAAQECKDERAANPQAFAVKYGTNANYNNAFGKCVSSKAKAKKDAADAKDEEQAEKRKNAARECKSERNSIGREAFAREHGTSRNKRDAFGKCVSKRARAARDFAAHIGARRRGVPRTGAPRPFRAMMPRCIARSPSVPRFE